MDNETVPLKIQKSGPKPPKMRWKHKVLHELTSVKATKLTYVNLKVLKIHLLQVTKVNSKLSTMDPDLSTSFYRIFSSFHPIQTKFNVHIG